MQLDSEGEDVLQLLLGEQGNCLWLLICFLSSARLPWPHLHKAAELEISPTMLQLLQALCVVLCT